MDQLELMRTVVRALETLGVPYFITGPMSSIHYGEHRFTHDIDIAVSMTPEQAVALARMFPEPEYYVSEEAARDSAVHRDQFNIIHPSSGLKVDVIVLKGSDFDFNRLERASRHAVDEDFAAFFDSPEDLIVKKMDFYREGGSEKHLRDITGMLKVSGESIDRTYITRWAQRLGLTVIWEAVQRRLGEA